MEEIYKMMKDQSIFEGTFEEFQRLFASREQKKKLYSGLVESNAYVGDFNSFLEFTHHNDNAITIDDLSNKPIGEGQSFGDKLGLAISSKIVGFADFFGLDRKLRDYYKAKFDAFEAKSAKTKKMKTLDDVFKASIPRSRTFYEMKKDGFFSGKNSESIKQEAEQKFSTHLNEIGPIVLSAKAIWKFAEADVKESFSSIGVKQQIKQLYIDFVYNLLKMQNRAPLLTLFCAEI